MARTIRFADVISAIWDGRKLVAWSVATAVVLGIALALLLPQRFEARVSFMPADSPDVRGGLGALGGRLSDLADLAGLAGSATGNVEKSLAVLVSRDFTDRFMREEKVLQVLFPDQWDEARQQWKPPSHSWVARIRGEVDSALPGARDSGQPRQELPGPSMWEAYRIFDRIRSVTRDRRTGVITLSITWRDPQLAARWANRLIERANEELRTRAIHEAERSIEYLADQLQKTNPLELRDVLFRLNESEQRKSMLAHVRHDFAFDVVDPAVTPKERVSPKRTLLVISAAALGFLIGVILVSARGLIGPGNRAR